MKEDEPNWFARWEEELPTPEELMPISQTLITPDLAQAFDIATAPTSPSSPENPNHHSQQLQHQHPSPPPHLLSSLHLHPETRAPPPQDFDSPELGGAASMNAGEEPARTLKRPRLVWTPQLHKRFVDAVAHLGIKNAVPKTIMQLMNVEGLTRENVASHLQKYRLYLKRMQGLSSPGGGGATAAPGTVSAVDAATDRLFASAPLPRHFLGRAPPPSAVMVPDPLLPFVPVSALQHHQQMAAAAVAQQQQYYHHQRHIGHHLGTSPGGGTFDQSYLSRPSPAMLAAQGGGAPVLPSPRTASNAEAPDSGAGSGGGGGRKMLTLFPTGED